MPSLCHLLSSLPHLTVLFIYPHRSILVCDGVYAIKCPTAQCSVHDLGVQCRNGGGVPVKGGQVWYWGTVGVTEPTCPSPYTLTKVAFNSVIWSYQLRY